MEILIGAIIAALFGAISIGAQSQENDKQRAANKELNEQNIDESEKSYQRSRPSAQVADLVAAGLTDQQARNIVASRGTAAVYAPPALTSTEAGVDMSGILSGIGNIGNAATGLGQFFAEDRKNPDGGLIGSTLAEKPAGIISDHLDDLPPDATTLSGFLKFARSSSAPSWASELVKSSDWKKCINNIQGNRALRSFFVESSQIASTDLNLAGSRLDNQMKSIQILLGNEEYTQEQLNTVALQLQTQFSLDTMPLVTQSKLTELRGQIAKFETDERLWTDPAYKTAYLASLLQDQENQLILGQCMHAIYSGQKQWLSDPDHAALVGVYSALEKVGLTSTSVGAIFAVAEASGIPISEGLRKAFEPAAGGLLGILEDAGQVVGTAANAVHSALNDVGAAGSRFVYSFMNNCNDRALYSNAKLVLKHLVEALPTGEISSVSEIVDKVYHQDVPQK